MAKLGFLPGKLARGAMLITSWANFKTWFLPDKPAGDGRKMLLILVAKLHVNSNFLIAHAKPDALSLCKLRFCIVKHPSHLLRPTFGSPYPLSRSSGHHK